jgi:hypothetical protein
MAVSVASMLAPEEVYKGSGKLVGESELTPDDRKRRRAQKKRSRKGYLFFLPPVLLFAFKLLYCPPFKIILICPSSSVLSFVCSHVLGHRKIVFFHLVSFAVCFFFHVFGRTMRNSYMLVALYS